MGKKSFAYGDLVFAKVKGFPAWPARITGKVGSKYAVFFFGTFETGNMNTNQMWPFNQTFKDRFAPPNLKRKLYSEGMHQIENMPDMALRAIGPDGKPIARPFGNYSEESVEESAKKDTVYVKVLASDEIKEIRVNSDAATHDIFDKVPSRSTVETDVGTSRKLLKICDDDDVDLEMQRVVEAVDVKIRSIELEQKELLLLKKIRRLEWLKMEQKLIDVVYRIQKSMSSTSKDPVICQELLGILESMEIRPLSVIKLPDIFVTVKRLSEEIDPVDDIAKDIKDKATSVKENIIKTFEMDPSSISSDDFLQMLELKLKEFEEKTSGMSERERLGVVCLED